MLYKSNPQLPLCNIGILFDVANGGSFSMALQICILRFFKSQSHCETLELYESRQVKSLENWIHYHSYLVILKFILTSINDNFGRVKLRIELPKQRPSSCSAGNSISYTILITLTAINLGVGLHFFEILALGWENIIRFTCQDDTNYTFVTKDRDRWKPRCLWEVVWSKNSELLHDMSTASLNGRTTPRQFDLEDQNPFVFIQFFKYWIILLGVLW